ncbi:hypothetical protein [Bradyrhizobium retamae]|nr:hypothetical protein [Bradyrhizobium retamae]
MNMFASSAAITTTVLGIVGMATWLFKAGEVERFGRAEKEAPLS